MSEIREREMVPVDMNGHANVTMNPVDISHWRHMQEWNEERGLSAQYPLKLGLLSSWECSYCLLRPDYEFTDETKTAIRVVQPCTRPQGITTVTEFVVRSGNIVCDDDLRDVYNIPDEVDRKFESYNTAVGVSQVIKENARMGCAYSYVGNTGPSLYRTGEGTYVIASVGWNEENDDGNIPDTWEALAWFCTDLWAASIADYQDFLDKGGTPVEEDDHYGTRTVIDFPNGTYRFTHHTGETGFDRDGYFGDPVIYTHIERIQ